MGNRQTVELLLPRSLESLRFLAKDRRHIQIPDAHRSTFQWIFQESVDPTCGWSNFAQWLETGSGFYWIRGNAGSGKSTLMKYHFDQEKTRRYLRKWAQNSNLQIIGFFIWQCGTAEQKSLAGIFRSLFYEVLRKTPELVRVVLPEDWSNCFPGTANETTPPKQWLVPRLKAAFRRWVELAPSSTRICFLLDGLDEYEGDHEDLCEFLKDISELCVSSRSEAVFDERLTGVPGLELQSLTTRDILGYVQDKFQGHPRISYLSQAEPQQAAELANKIMSKASGVFTWVTIVVNALLRDIRNHDSIGILRQSLRDFPPDLN